MKEISGKRRLRMSFVMLGASTAFFVVSYLAATILEVWRLQQQTPRLAADSLVKALRTHHRQAGRFPNDFRELETRVWKHRSPPDFGADGRSLSIANYYYLYHPVEGNSCTIWIIPVGPRRDEGSTHFLLLSPSSLRRWKGPPLALDEIGRLRGVPQYGEMSLLGMTEQQPIDLVKRK